MEIARRAIALCAVALGRFAISCSTGDAGSGGHEGGVDSRAGEPIDSTAQELSDDHASASTDVGTVGPFDAPSVDSSQCTAQLEEAGVCNDLTLSSSAVTPTCVAGEAPTAQGGSISDGTYVLQSVVLYGGCPAEGTFITTWSICGSAWQVAETASSEAGSSTLRVDFTADVGATSVTLTPTCLADVNEPTSVRGYTVFGEQLLSLQTIEGATSVGIYQRQ